VEWAIGTKVAYSLSETHREERDKVGPGRDRHQKVLMAILTAGAAVLSVSFGFTESNKLHALLVALLAICVFGASLPPDAFKKKS
jgi:uncharacterized membrane protein